MPEYVGKMQFYLTLPDELKGELPGPEQVAMLMVDE